MDAVRGIYHDGIIELIEKPATEETAEVLIIFPQKTKKITKIYGLFKAHVIDYNAVKKELIKLDRESQEHMMDEFKDG